MPTILKDIPTPQDAEEKPRYRNCSVARTLDIISDSWTFLVIRELFFGVHRFEDYLTNLSIPRATLSQKLKLLVEEGIFKKVKCSNKHKRFEYHFTRKGIELYPIMNALLKWGDKWLLPEGETPPVALFHKTCGSWTTPMVVCSECGGEVHARNVTYRDGPGAGQESSAVTKRIRRSSKPAQFKKARRCSVGRSLAIIGDRWTFMIMRETFFGVRRYDEFLNNLGIATNILSNRLQQLVEDGLLNKVQYQSKPDRYEYRLTDMGRDLYGAYIVMLAWGDKWLAGKKGKPLILKHIDCGKDFTAEVVCSNCREVLNAWQVGAAGH